MSAVAASFPQSLTNSVARICLGPSAPAEMADFLARAGLEVLPYAHKHHVALYVDFVGARPSGVEVVSVDLVSRGTRSARLNADLTTDNWQTAACFVISHAMGLKPALLTADPAMLGIVSSTLGVAASHVPVILSGEIGVGKYNLARLIHRASRCRGPLVTMNCSSFEEVDTAAVHGIFREAGGRDTDAAVVFLDEIGELTDSAQVKLLQLLQAAERTPWNEVGRGRGSLRFIAATNRPLAAMVSRGDFRSELFWRLNVFTLEVLPLRQRAGDVPILASYFLRRANPRRLFTPMALKVMSAYSFPGNVLELESLVTRLAIAPLSSSNLVDVSDVRRQLTVAPASGEPQVSGWKSSREEARREMIVKTIAATGGNRAEAAQRLGITLRTLQYHITRAGLSRRRSAGANRTGSACEGKIGNSLSQAESAGTALHDFSNDDETMKVQSE